MDADKTSDLSIDSRLGCRWLQSFGQVVSSRLLAWNMEAFPFRFGILTHFLLFLSRLSCNSLTISLVRLISFLLDCDRLSFLRFASFSIVVFRSVIGTEQILQLLTVREIPDLNRAICR